MIELEKMKDRLNENFLTIPEFLVAIGEDVNSERTQLTKTTEFDAYRKKTIVKEYYNIPASFDIETTNMDDTKTSYMYIAQVNINGHSTYVRTWQEFARLLAQVAKIYELGPNRRMVFYIHNMGFEMSFLMPRLKKIAKMFALAEHEPAKVILDCGFEFRDSLKLSGLSLEKTAENLTMFKIKKMVGDLDYSKKRNSKTPMSDKELGYCLHDVTTLTAYIYEQIVQYGTITNIPMTNTGRVRRYIKEHCLYKQTRTGNITSNKKYRDTIKSLTLTPDEYTLLKKCFQGGFTHGNHKNVGKTWQHVDSYDFTSSYPTIICSEKFPMGKGEEVCYKSWKDYFADTKDYCIMAVVDFDNLDEKFTSEHYISSSKCIDISGAIEDNGRVVSCNHCTLCITEQDMDIIMKNYSCTGCRIKKAIRYKKDYLPKEFIECVLHFYESKTTLKDVAGREAEYQLLKGMLNSMYGMCVTDIVQPETTYSKENGWSSEEVNLAEQIDRYNKDKNRTTFFPWGVWITAYARHNLWSGIFELGDDYIYSDTDSVKCLNAENHQAYFDSYNSHITEKIKAVANHYGIDPDKANPVSKDGEHKPLGIWDHEGYFDEFKTLGAKRYILTGFHKPNGKLKADYMITIAGISKSSGGQFIFSKDSPFDFFQAGMLIPSGSSGKMAVSYSNEHHEEVVTDEYGNSELMSEEGCAYIYETEYNMSISQKYLSYILSGDNEVKPVAKILGSLKSQYER